MRKIEVKIEDYKSYLEKYKSEYLDKKNMIFTNGKKSFINKLFKVNEEEIFNGLETKYTIQKNGDDYLISFDSNSNIKYRFDLLKEPNSNIYHLGFSLFNSNTNNYHSLTNNNESLEVFNRLIWILKDVTPKLNVDEYCIGSTGTQKDNIYNYMMKFISGWEKRNTTYYPLGWALYFKL